MNIQTGLSGTVFFSVIRKSAKTGRSLRFDGAWSQESAPSTHPLTMAVMRKPLEYHALGGQSFRIPSTGKYTIEKVKPSQGQPITGNEVFTHSGIPVSF